MDRETFIGGHKVAHSIGNVVASVEFLLRAALHDYVDSDFVHSISGSIVAEAPNEHEEDAGRIGASLVQFSLALDHGISTARLGDGVSGEISEYWEYLFDPESGYLKEEIQTEYEVVSLDLLIIDYIEVYPKFRGLGIGAYAINRTIDVFGSGCGLIACKPWPLQFTPAIASDAKALKRLDAPNVAEEAALRKLRTYWSRIGFWPLGNTGIYALSVSQRGCEHRPRNSRVQ
jgi:GNAT superfamily N-acetyltransferase